MELEIIFQITITLAVAAILYVCIFHKPDFTPDHTKPDTYADVIFPGNPAKIRSMSELTNYTVDELRNFNGVDDKPLYVSIGGKVFDCTPGASFYGPGGPYEMFAGRDISLAAAKFSKELHYLDSPSLSNITPSERESFFTFYNMLYGKYNLVGMLTGVDYSAQLEEMKKKHIDQMNNLATTAAMATGAPTKD